MSDFILSNLNQIKKDNLDLLLKSNEFRLFGKKEDIHTFKIDKTQITFLLDGYILPRHAIFNNHNKSSKFILLQELYEKYGLDLINYIKGNFVLLVIINKEIYAYNDRIGIRKFFYYTEKSDFILTSNLKLLTGMITSQIDNESLAIYLIMNQFVDGRTFIKNVFQSTPSSRVNYNGVSGTTGFDSYWRCDELLKSETKEISNTEFSRQFAAIVRQYIEYLNPEKISTTLTGGLDSRVILAALLYLGETPATFTYGHPYSGDVIIAKQIAGIIGLDHKNHYSNPSADWFSNCADKIINRGKSIIHIHRAHRLSAVSDFSPGDPGSEILFGGYLGGELIRNFFYDGIIVTDFTKEWIEGKKDRSALILKYLKKNLINTDSININTIKETLLNQKYSGIDVRLNEFFFTFLGMATSYHSQDINLFGDYVEYPVPIFLDIDFLEMIFQSGNNFMAVNVQQKFINRIKGQELYSHLISGLFPPLADIPLAKQGGYKPKEVIEDNKILFIWKRIIRKFFYKQKYTGNFILDDWMKDYVGSQIEDLQNSKKLGYLINVADLVNQFKINNHKTSEKYWRKFTNPIFFNKLFEFYLK